MYFCSNEDILVIMKILTGAQIHELEKYTIEHKPIKSIDLMEEAAQQIFLAIKRRWSKRDAIIVFAGPGNNGGDALAVARLLAKDDYIVSVYLFNINNKLSEDCVTNKKRLLDTTSIKNFTEITLNFEPPELTAGTLVIDGLFGSGLNKPLYGGFASLVRYINQSPCKVISIDMPSGMMTEDNSMNVLSNIIKANLTLTIGNEKLSMFLDDMLPYFGKIEVLYIGLLDEYVEKIDAIYNTNEKIFVLGRKSVAHKGDMGHALLVAGKYGMAGAAVLAAKACLRSGVGKITVHTPKLNNDILQISVPEAIVSHDIGDEHFTEPIDTKCYQAMGIGPGLGQDEDTAIAMIAQIRRAQCPVVVDADALNMLASHRAWMQQLPKKIILTPHPKEFDRLVGNTSDSCFERLSKALNLAQRIEGYILLKGHHSALCLPNGKVIFNTTGNAGMATAGSGDVLTGIITGLLARGYCPADACMRGMDIHGKAGDLAAEDLGEESMTAGDLIKFLPKAFPRDCSIDFDSNINNPHIQ